MKVAYKKKLQEQNFTGTQAEAAYETFEALLKLELLNGDGAVTLQGIGRLSVKSLKARKGINPKTKAPIDIPARLSVGFKPAPSLKKELNSVKTAPK